jgi:hypothetical protein
MKSIFYIGAALMIGAGIYGFVDYKKVNQTKEFKTLYDGKEVKADNSSEFTEIDQSSIVKPVLKEAPMKTATVSPAKEEIKPVAKTAKKQKVKKKKRLSSKLFSRSTLEAFEPPQVISDEPVAEVITEKKEQ